MRLPLLLVLSTLAFNALAADKACIATRTVPFDKFMQGAVAEFVHVPVQVLVPAAYEHAQLQEDPFRSYWMRPAAVEQVRKSDGDLTKAGGYLYGLISMSVAYDPEKDVFPGSDQMAEEFKKHGFSDAHSEYIRRNGVTMLVFDAKGPDGKRIRAAYFGLNVATNAVYDAYMPPPGDPDGEGDCFWPQFVRTLRESPEEAPMRREAPSDGNFLSMLDESYKPLLQSFVDAARAGNQEGMFAILSPSLSEADGGAALRETMATQVIPYFADVEKLDRYSAVNGATFPDGTTGTIVYTYVVTKDGRHKPITFAVRNEGKQLRAVNFTMSCVPNRHPRTEGRCDK
jgi:hypothetical protein